MEALPNKVKDLSMEMHEMHTAIEELAEHIVEPVAAKLSTEELGRILSRINYAFQQLNIKHIPGDTNFENIAFTIFRVSTSRPKEIRERPARYAERRKDIDWIYVDAARANVWGNSS